MTKTVNAFGKLISFPADTADDEILSFINQNQAMLDPEYKEPEIGMLGKVARFGNDLVSNSPTLTKAAQFGKEFAQNSLGVDMGIDTSAQPTGQDYLKGFASGANKLVSGVGYLAEVAGAKDTGRSIREFGDRGAAYWNNLMSEGGKKAASDQVFEDDEESITGLRLSDNWGKALLMGASQSAPSMFAAAVPGAMATSAIQKLASLGLAGGSGATIPLLAGTAAPVGVASNIIARTPAAIGFGSAEGITAGAMNAADLKSSIEGMPIEELRKSPVFAVLESEHGEDAARSLIAEQAASDVFGRTAVSTGTIGALTGGGALGQAYQKATGAAKGGILNQTIKGSAQEALQEAPQSGMEKLIENVAVRDYLNPDQNIMEGVLADAASGAAIGGLMGGVVGGAGAVNVSASRAAKINEERTKLGLNKIASSGSVDEAINAAAETVSQKPVTPKDIWDDQAARDDLLMRAEQINQQKGVQNEAQVQGTETPAAETNVLDAKSVEMLLNQAVSNDGSNPIPSAAQLDKDAPESDIIAQNLGNAAKGAATEIILPDNTTLPAEWMVVDADNVKATMKNGANQPRDRTRAAADVQIQQIANQPDYRRMSDSPVMDIGAPTLSSDGAIVGGNGRFEGVSRGYDAGTSAAYRSSLEADAISKGIDPATFSGMKKPVLVRRVTQPFDTQKLAVASNSGGSLEYSALERAKIDAERIGDIDQIDVTDSGDIALTKDNAANIRNALKGYSASELGSFVDNEGNLSQEGSRRLKNAILYSAYGNSKTLSRMVESTDTDMRNIVGALTKTAGQAAKVRSNIKSGGLPKSLDITDNLIEAVEKIGQIRSSGDTVENYLTQGELFSDIALSDTTKEIMIGLSEVMRSQKRMVEFLRATYNLIEKADVTTDNVFGEPDIPSKLEVVKHAKKQTAEQRPGSLFGEETGKESAAKVNNVTSAEAGAKYSRSPEERLKDRERSRKLERALQREGYDFRIQARDVRLGITPDGKGQEAIAAEQIARIFRKRISWIEADGDFKINGVMVPSIPDTIFIDVNSNKSAHVVMGHELSHHMEQDVPEVYQAMVDALMPMIRDVDAYHASRNLDDMKQENVIKEIVGDIVGDNFANPEFWNKVAAYNPNAFRKIADTIISWIKRLVTNAKARGLGSQQWVTDAQKSQDIVAKAVSQYTYTESSFDGLKNKPVFQKAWHGSPHDHDKFDSSKIGTGEGAQAYGFGLYFTDTKEVAEWYKDNLSYEEYDRAIFFINGVESDPSVINDEVIRDEVQRLIDNASESAETHAIDLKGSLDNIIRDAKEDIDLYYDDGDIEFSQLQDRISEAENLKETGLIDPVYKAGRIYQVELTPKPDEYLLWDKPLSEQSEKVRKALFEIRKNQPKDSVFSQSLQPFENSAGDSLYRALSSDSGSAVEASKIMHAAGIRGIKYLDGSSRGGSQNWQEGLPEGWRYYKEGDDVGIKNGKGLIMASGYRTEAEAHKMVFGEKPSFNYVIFDDKDVEITAKFSFAGKKSNTANKYQLSTAQERLSNGENAETVRKETGWFKGVDGKWRYEIDDSDAHLKKPFNSKTKGWGDIAGTVPISKLTIGNILEHERLFSAYPDLRDITVGRNAEGARGIYRTGKNHIDLNSGLKSENVLSVLLHELQHAIQDNEGFAFGGSPATSRITVKNLMHELLSSDVAPRHRVRRLEEAIEKVREIEEKRGFVKTINRWRRDPESIKKYTEWFERTAYGIPKKKGSIERRDALEEIVIEAVSRRLEKMYPLAVNNADAEARLRNFVNDKSSRRRDLLESNKVIREFKKDFPDYNKKLFEKMRDVSKTKRYLKELTDYEMYSRLGGEIEARNVQFRQKWNEDQRRETSPEASADIPADEAIVVYNGKVMDNAPPPANSVSEIQDTITINGKERPTRNSNGKLIHPTEEGIRNFWKWFGDSKVVDDQGRPLVVYHGTSRFGFVDSIDIDKFDKAKIGDRFNADEIGFFFSSSKAEASDYSMTNSIGTRVDEGAVYPVYLSINNAFTVDDETVDDVFGYAGPSDEGTISYWDNNQKWIIDYAVKNNNNGIIVDDGSYKMYVAFESNQIKSATGNTGKFSPDNDDIRFSRTATEDVDKKANSPRSRKNNKILYHGSSQTFDKFDLSHFGEGEGGGAFGYGIHLTESEEVGREYVTPDTKVYINGEAIYANNPLHYLAKNILEKGYDNFVKEIDGLIKNNPDRKDFLSQRLDKLKSLKNAHIKDGGREGKLYRVEILPNDDEFLLWDKPLGKQSKKVYDALYDLTKTLDDSDKGGEVYTYLNRKDGLDDKITSRKLYELGIKGIKYKNTVLNHVVGNKVFNYTVFSPDDVLILPDDNAQFSRAETLSQAGVNTEESAKPSSLPEETKFQAFRRRSQDAMLRFKVMQNWLKEQGVNLSESANVYQRENISKGKTANRIEDFRREQLEPLIKSIAETSKKATGEGKFDLADIATYLEAVHIPEANERMRTIHKDDKATANGITDKQARDVIKQFEAMPNFSEFKKLADDVRKIGVETLDMRLDAGLISQEQYDAYKSTYKNWVPLRGNMSKQGFGKGMSTNAKDKRRMGHGFREEEFVIENLVQDRERAIMQIEKNKIGMTVAQFLMEAENPNIGTIDKPVKMRVMKDFSYAVTFKGRAVGSFETEAGARNAINKIMERKGDLLPEGESFTQTDFNIDKSYDPHIVMMARPQLAENEIQVYVNGHAVKLQLNDPGLARAATNAGIEQVGAIAHGARMFNRFLSKAYTAWSPDFLFMNMARDAYSGTLVLTGKKGAAFAAKTFTNYGTAVRELINGRNDPKKSEWVSRYRAAGGNIGAAYLSDIERVGEDALAALQEFSGARETYRMVYNEQISKGAKPAKARTMAALKAGVAKTKTAPVVGHMFKTLERVNMVIENALRLATFKTAVESGESDQQAAMLSKDLMNFNRKGEVANQMGALYLFYNPGMQGAHIVGEALFTSKHRKQVWSLLGALTTLSFILAEFARGGEDDDDREWENTPDYIKDRNLIFQFGDKQITVPVAYGFGIFHAMGNYLSDLNHGADKSEIAVKLASGMFENFSVFGNPIIGDDGDTEIRMDQVLPTLPKLIMAPGINMDSLGRQIHPTKYQDSVPDSQLMWRSVRGTAYEDIAHIMNDITGGSQYNPGAIDISPNTIKYWVTALTGGAGRFVSDITTGGLNAAEGISPEIENVPVLRKFIREPGVNDSRGAFHKAKKEAQTSAERAGKALRNGDMPEYTKMMTELQPIIDIAKYARDAQKMASMARDEIMRIQLDKDMSKAEKKLRIKEIELQEKRVYDQFLSAFDVAKSDSKK